MASINSQFPNLCNPITFPIVFYYLRVESKNWHLNLTKRINYKLYIIGSICYIILNNIQNLPNLAGLYKVLIERIYIIIYILLYYSRFD